MIVGLGGSIEAEAGVDLGDPLTMVFLGGGGIVIEGFIGVVIIMVDLDVGRPLELDDETSWV